MADFCYDCTFYLFGDGSRNDFVGMLSEEDVNKGYLVTVLCEGCGHIMIDHKGKKIKTINEAVQELKDDENTI